MDRSSAGISDLEGDTLVRRNPKHLVVEGGGSRAGAQAGSNQMIRSRHLVEISGSLTSDLAR